LARPTSMTIDSESMRILVTLLSQAKRSTVFDEIGIEYSNSAAGAPALPRRVSKVVVTCS
jgi:hypothetical protein